MYDRMLSALDFRHVLPYTKNMENTDRYYQAYLERYPNDTYEEYLEALHEFLNGN